MTQSQGLESLHGLRDFKDGLVVYFLMRQNAVTRGVPAGQAARIRALPSHVSHFSTFQHQFQQSLPHICRYQATNWTRFTTK